MKYLKSVIVPIAALIAPVAHAVSGGSSGGISGIVSEPTNIITSVSDITKLFCSVLNWMFWGLIVASIVMFLVGGYTYVTAADDPQKVSTANKILLYAAIAVAVGILAGSVPGLIASFFGVTSLTTC